MVQPQAPVAVTNAAYVTLSAQRFAYCVEIEEDGSGAAQGLVVQWPNGNVDNYPPSQQPIVLGNAAATRGPLVGVPQGDVDSWGGRSPATVYCNVKSMGANTEVRVTEHC